MSFIAKLQRAREILAQQGRLSTRALERELETGGDELDELVEELVDVQQVARREGKILIWTGGPATPPPDTSAPSPRTTPTQRAADQSETRKIISILFADLMGSTALQERLDPESVNRVMDAYYRAVRVPVEAAGGTLVQLLGDGVLCAFGIPRIAEDDALRAVRAAMGIQEAFREFLHAQQWLTVSIGLRVAVNTGEVVVSDEHPAGIGDPLNVAARLQQEARDGEVLIGQATRRLVADAVTLERAGTFALKGRAETVTAYRVLSLERPTGTTAAFVGRAEELVRLTAVYEAAVATPAARLAVLLGSPGLGKSRLIDEVGRRLADSAHLIAAHCDEAGGATFAPIAEALREWLNSNPLADKEGPGGAGKVGQVARSAIEAALTADSSSDPSTEASARADRARVVAGISALLAGSPASPEETFFVIRRFLRALAKEKPVVLVIDDLQWAEPLLLDLVEHLIQWGSGVPLFVAVGARPELRERRSSLATVGGFVSEVVTLSGLDAGAAMRLAANVIGAADLPAAVAAKVLASSEGNPLFVSELVRMLVDEGAIEMRGDRWTVGANLAALEMPPTIHALLAARIERLQPEERTVLERASVVGRHFSRGAVAALLGRNGSALDARLEALRRTELIEPDTGWLLGEPVLRFHHVLIRDAAYRRLLKGTRAELHERLANWIEAQGQEASEHDETIGRHLEQAHQLLGEIGPLDASAKGLGKRAAQRLSAAGRRALAGDDVPVAADLLGRAVDRLDHDDPARADLALDWCEALLSAGDVAAAEKAIAELGRFAGAASTAPTDSPSRQTSRLTAWHTCFTGQLTVMTAPQELQTAADAVAAAANQFVDLDDAGGEAKAHFVHALALARLGRVGACEASLDRALAAARRAGDRRRANTVLAIAPLAALWGPSPVTRASGRCLDVVRVLRITQGAPAVEAVALSCQGVLEALRGRTEAAHRMIASGRKMVEELGIAQRLFETDVFAGFVALLEGDGPAAERTLRGAYDGLRDLGLGIDAARAAALLARTLLAQDRSDEAEVLSHESEALAGDDLKAAIAWRGVRAEALAKRGEHTEAIDLARAAVAIAATTDALLDHADARLALAAALRAAGRSAEADAEHRRAIDLWEAKGATLLAESARRRASPAATPVAAPAARVAHAPRRRPVRPNFAIEEARRAEAVVAARDVQALESLYRRDVEIVDHQFGIEYGHDAIVERVRLTIQESTDGAFRHEDLATLGDFVALCRLHSTASGSVVHDVPFGATEVTYLLVIEADEQGCARRIDIFGEDALRDAVVRLYERYAALLPKGPARTRAAATAQSMAILQSANADPERLAPVLAPDIEGIDHRHLSNWSLRGAPAYLDHLRALHQVADDVDFQWREVLALAPGALLARTLHHGTERLGGGAYERWFLSLFVVGADGRFTRAEWFDEDREGEALARFEELVPGPVDGIGANDEVSRLVRRRVRPNAASALVEGIEAGFAARDRDALERLLSEPLQTIEHPTGVTYGREGQLESIDRMLDLPDLDFRLEALATLGDGLCLARRRVRASGKPGGRFDVADYEMDHLVLTDVGEDGVWRSEVFSVERCGAAIVRLYELHGARLGEGPEAARSAGIARAVSAIDAPVDVERLPGAYARDLTLADHRILATWSCASRDELASHFGHQLELVHNFTGRIDDVLALGPTMLLAHVTYHGIGRDSGGAFENRICVLYRFGDDGRVAAVDCYEAEREADALARFDALAAVPAGPEPSPLPFDNAASRADREFVRRFNTRDWAGIEALAAPELVFDERRRMLHNSCAREVWLEQLRVMFDVPASRFTTTLRATRGERLALNLHCFAGEVPGGGPLEMEDHFALHEVDGAGRIVAILLFDVEAEDAAFAELDRLYGAGDGCQDETWQPTLRLPAALSRGDVDACRAMLAPGFRVGDHRKLGWGDTLRDADTFLQAQIALSELSPDWRYRIDHHRARGRVQLGQQAQVGTREGGPFENPFLVVADYDEAGLVLAFDIYDVDQLDQARARFVELAGTQGSSADRDPVASFEFEAVRDSDGPRSRVWNRADTFRDRVADAWHARDWPAIEALLHEGFRFSDRRPLIRLDLGRDGWMEMSRRLGDMRSSRVSIETIATRGERLVLWRVRIEVAGGDVGPSLLEHLNLFETNDAGDRLVWAARFEATDVAAAYAELDARYEAGEAAAAPRNWPPISGFVRAVERRDWDAVRGLCRDDFVQQDHRGLAILGRTEGADAWVDNFRTLVELAPDSVYRVHHIREAERGYYAQGSWLGTREGGPYEIQVTAVLELDDEGRFRRADIYDDAVADAAFARLAELDRKAETRTAVARSRETAATRCMDRFWNAYLRTFETGEWETLREGCAPGVVFDDRRRLALVSGGIDFMIASLQERARVGARPRWEVVARSGERVLVQRVVWSGGPSDGRFEIEYLGVIECDADGALTAALLFDTDDERAAHQEAWTRWAAIEPEMTKPLEVIAGLADGFNAKDRARIRRLCADDLAYHDHRRTGVGRIDGADAAIASINAYWDLAGNQELELGSHWPAYGRHGGVTVVRRFGTLPDGGAFESEYLEIFVIADGRVTHLELFEIEELGRALARFEELRPPEPGLPPAPRFRATGGETGGREDTLHIPPNAATRSIDRWTQASLAGDADAVGALLDPSYTLEDRRRLFRTVTDRNAEIAGHLPLIHEGGWQPARTVLATAGDRLALQRWLWTKGESDARSEVEFLEIDELGDSGRFVRSIIFDPEDRAEASRELLERYVATGADGMPHGLFETMRAWNEHDLQRVRDSLSADFVLDDHRLAGMERLEGPDAYIASVAALFELIPDARTEILHIVANESHGRVSVNRTWGLNREGGEVESLFVLLTRFRDGKVSYFELFEVEHLHVALARLADLRLGRTNAATRARERQAAAFVARDWDAVRRLATADFVYEDRGKRALVTGDVEAWVTSMQFTSQPGFRPRLELIGTFGDRIALDRVVWSGEPGGDAFEFERIRVLEADADGQMRAVIMFDPEDRLQASNEAMMRFAAAESAAPARGLVAWGEVQRAKRWDDLRTICTPDFAAVDHRPLGVLGTLDREQWAEALKAIDGLSDGVTYAWYDVLAWNDSAIVVAVARTGTITDGGGPIHDEFLSVARVAHGRLQRVDVFAEHDMEGALASFDAGTATRS